MSAEFRFYNLRRYRNPNELPDDAFFQLIPDAVVAAMIETVRNYIMGSIVVPIILSTRMLYQVFDVALFFRYSNAVFQTFCFHPLLKWVICCISPLTSACNGDFFDYHWTSLIILIPCLLDPGDPPLSRFEPFNRRFARPISTAIICMTWLIWDFRASLYHVLYNQVYEEKPSWVIEPLLVILLTIIVSPIAALLDDELLLLLCRIVIALGCIHIAICYLTTRSYLQPFLIVILVPAGIQACRCIRGVAAEILGTEMFARRGSFTSGLNFFTTHSGLTGSTSGPIRSLDHVVMINGANDSMVIRRCGDDYEVVGAAYIGNKSRTELEKSSTPWKMICIR
jgi:hypothetical protein